MAKKHNTGGSVIPGRTKELISTNLLLFIIAIVFVAMYIGAMLLLKKSSLRPQIFFNILDANAVLIITSCGMSLVMITGEIDISVDDVVTPVSISCAVHLDYQGGDVFTSLLITLGIDLALRTVQGFLVAYLDIQPLIVSLAGIFFARGMTAIIHAAPFSMANEAFSALKNVRINIPELGTMNRLRKYINAYVEIGVIMAVLTVIILFCMLKWTKLGRNFYAVGGNRQSALVLGINVKRTRFLSRLLYGLLTGIDDYIYFLHMGSGSASHANGMEMNTITSSITGGTLLTGGAEDIFGAFMGVLSLSTIQNIVSSIGLDQAWWTGVTVAGMLCVFLVVQSVILTRKR